MSNNIEEILQSVFKACHEGDLDKVKEIHQSYLCQGLFNAITNNDIEKADSFLAQGADVNNSVSGLRPLTVASHLGNAYFIKFLVDHGANINGEQNNGEQVNTIPAMIIMNHKYMDLAVKVELLKLILAHDPDLSLINLEKVETNADDKQVFKSLIDQKVLSEMVDRNQVDAMPLQL